MGPDFTYMGTKRRIADDIAEIISQAKAGPLLDLFAGVSAIGTAVAPERNIWCNDIQHFSYNVARVFFASQSDHIVSKNFISQCREYFEKNRLKLEGLNADALSIERELLSSSNAAQIRAYVRDLVASCESEEAAQRRRFYRERPRRKPFCLFTISYAGGYIGLQQAIELDSVRYAIEGMAESRAVNADQRRWMIVAMCRALAKVSNSTGHFAQYLDVKESTKLRFLAKRRRSIWSEWQTSLSSMAPVGSAHWRASNKVSRREAIHLLRNLAGADSHPAVVYADPPYTSDHYSRYYHLLDTAILYDYPDIVAKGQYRFKRFSSPFSLKSAAFGAFRDLIEAAARLKSTFVLSYPDNGLLPNSTEAIVKLLRHQFRKAEIAMQIPHHHSSMGASKGFEKSPVTEIIFVASH